MMAKELSLRTLLQKWPVSPNMLRYTVGGKVTWHDRIQKYELGDCSAQTSV